MRKRIIFSKQASDKFDKVDHKTKRELKRVLQYLSFGLPLINRKVLKDENLNIVRVKWYRLIYGEQKDVIFIVELLKTDESDSEHKKLTKKILNWLNR